MNLTQLAAFLKDLKAELGSDSRTTLSQVNKDISLSTDKHLHKEITNFLDAGSPYPVLSEEGGEQVDFREYSGYFWIIDPLDGTLNYSRSIPMYCISIALWCKQEPIVGIIYDIYHDEMFTGVVKESEICNKKGAWLNEKTIDTSPVESKNQGVICTGFPSWRDYGTDSLTRFVRKVQEWKKVRMIGSAALSLTWVACGRAEAYMEEDIRIWDVAAGLAIVKAAGGEIYFKASERTNFITAAAVNRYIPMKEIL
ncbi:MAG: inositol monophosphatase [Candidatus Aminicenantes bacterium]|nr:inositol monophosphatase [Candidatus Aminicenantes bacterium]